MPDAASTTTPKLRSADMSENPAPGSRDLESAALPPSSWWVRESLLVAASSGVDSTVLLDLLDAHRREHGAPARLAAAYLDHSFRGAEGSRDAELVGDLCARRGIAFFRGQADVPALARRDRLSPEAAGRRARYAFLADAATREGYAGVATAHHADDELETLLVRLQRGRWEERAAGILPRVRISGVEVVRPLLGVPRLALLAHAEERRLPFREDASNRDLRLPRNRLRHLCAPAVDRLDARRLVQLAALRRRLLNAAAERLDPLLASEERGGVRLPVASVIGLDPALRRTLLRRAYGCVAGAGAPLSERALDQLERLVASPAGGRLSVRQARARVSCGWAVLEPLPGATAGARPRDRAPGEATPPGAGSSRPAPAAWLERFDPDQLQGPLVLRSWQPGDRIEVRLASRGAPSESSAPQSSRSVRASAHDGVRGGGASVMTGRKKLKELFREARVPVWERAHVPVLADGHGVLWVPGLRRGDRARPGPGRPTVTVRVARAAGGLGFSWDIERPEPRAPLRRRPALACP